MRRLYQIMLVIVVLAAAIIAVFIRGQTGAGQPALQNQQPSQNVSQYNQTAVNPGFEPYFSCPVQVETPVPIQITNYTGMSMSVSDGITDYVLHPGGRGSIVYGALNSGTVITPSGSASVATSGNTGNYSTRYQNNVTLYHQVQVQVNYTVTQANSTSGASGSLNSTNQSTNQTNQSTMYKSCYTIPSTGTVCTYGSSPPNPRFKMVNSVSLSHTGVSVQAYSKHVQYNPTVSGNFSILNISANSTSARGTYWMSIAGGPCYGGQLALLTIGNSPYAINSSTSSGIYS